MSNERWTLTYKPESGWQVLAVWHETGIVPGERWVEVVRASRLVEEQTAANVMTELQREFAERAEKAEARLAEVEAALGDLAAVAADEKPAARS